MSTRQPLQIGETITARLPGHDITLTRTTSTYRVTVLDCYARPADPAWCRNFTSEPQARMFARAACLTFRRPGDTIQTITSSAATAA